MNVVRLATYLSVGVISAAVDVCVLSSLLALHVRLWFATLIAFLSGLTLNYGLHSRFTFSVQRSWVAFTRYLSLVVFNYGLTLCFVLSFEYFHLAPVLGKLVSLPFLAATGYAISKYWVYR